MSKGLVILVVTVLAIAIMAGVMFMNKDSAPDYTSDNPTARQMRAGVYTIACEDAHWLVTQFEAVVNAKLPLIEEYFKSRDNATGEELTAGNERLAEIYLTDTQEDIALKKWQEEIDYVASNLFGGEPEKKAFVMEDITNSYMALYSAMTYVYSGEITKEEVIQTVNEGFCTPEQ